MLEPLIGGSLQRFEALVGGSLQRLKPLHRQIKALVRLLEPLIGGSLQRFEALVGGSLQRLKPPHRQIEALVRLDLSLTQALQLFTRRCLLGPHPLQLLKDFFQDLFFHAVFIYENSLKDARKKRKPRRLGAGLPAW